MTSDTVTKILLALIAIALWANLLVSPSRPAVVSAAVQEDAMVANMETMANIEMMVENINENLEIIALGSCMNSRLC